VQVVLPGDAHPQTFAASDLGLDLSVASDKDVIDAALRWIDVDPAAYTSLVINRPTTGNIVISPKAVFGGDSTLPEMIGCFLLILILDLALGAWSVNVLLGFAVDKTIGFGWALLIGLAGGVVTIPVGVIVWALQMAGILPSTLGLGG
jgi:hypothetical protein